jgi:hypothetical protein
MVDTTITKVYYWSASHQMDDILIKRGIAGYCYSIPDANDWLRNYLWDSNIAT